MPHPRFREFVRAEHEAPLRRWIQKVSALNKATPASLVTEMNRWIKEKQLPINSVNRNSLERFVEEKNKTGSYRIDMKWLWQFLWDRYVQWCPDELLAASAPTSTLPEGQRAASTYRGIDVSGIWTVDAEHHRKITLDIQQDHDVLYGTSTHVKKLASEPGDDVHIYNLEGRVYNLFVLLNGVAKRQNRLAINTWLLEIMHDGQIMSGFVTAYNTRTMKLFSLHCACRRAK